MSRRHSLAVGAAAGVVVVAAAVWLLAGSGLLTVRTVQVLGARQVPVAQVHVVVDRAVGQPLATVDTAALARRVSALDGVAGASVERRWPHGLVVRLRERLAVAAVRRSGGWSGLDASGVVFGPPSLHPATGMRIASLAGPGSGPLAAGVLAALPPSVDAQVREVIAGVDGQVQLRLADGALVVWGGPQLAEQKAQVLAVLLRRPAHVYDVSSPSVVTTR